MRVHNTVLVVMMYTSLLLLLFILYSIKFPYLSIIYNLLFIATISYQIIYFKRLSFSILCSGLFALIIFLLYLGHLPLFPEVISSLFLLTAFSYLFDFIKNKLPSFSIFYLVNILIIAYLNIPIFFGRIRGDFNFFNQWSSF